MEVVWVYYHKRSHTSFVFQLVQMVVQVVQHKVVQVVHMLVQVVQHKVMMV